MFRLSMTLTEDIDPAVLAAALKSTLHRMPSFSQHLKRGFFWYYLAHSGDVPPVRPDINNPCVYLNTGENKSFLFRVSYYRERIAVDFFHVLTDGTGGLSFLKTLAAEYLALKYGAEIPRDGEILDCSDSPREEEYEDSFFRYAKSVRVSRRETPAYHIRGTREALGTIHITTAVMSLAEIKVKARELGATVNELLAAVMISSIHKIQQEENRPFRRKQAVKVSIPINLRKRFPACTLRNFTSYVNLGIAPRLGSYSIEEIVVMLKHAMALKASDKMLAAKFSTNVASEKNRLLSAAPLFVKDPVMKFYYLKDGDRYNSTTLSNLGLVVLPEEMARYVDRIGFMLGAGHNPAACACVGFNDKLCFTITRTIAEPLVEHAFFTALADMGIRLALESNRR
ncbi:MAG: hypothetical protein LBL15_04750 [Oscillospiraceae bacterium]|nr:hypothetical protein [Oscillospiraceae bacterium]